MTALDATSLRQRLLHKDHEKRLVISPILDPTTQLRENQAAIDVRLGRSFALVKPWTHGVAELFDSSGATREPPLETIVLDFGEPLIIHPHQFVLARTLEFVRLPADLMAYVIGRSSWGRRGLIVATAVIVHPGFAGPITLELKNVGEVPLALYPLDRVAQLAIHMLEGSGKNMAQSQFASSFVPSLGTVRDPATSSRIRDLMRKRML